MGHFLRATIDFIINHIQVIIGLISLLAAFLYAPGPHVEVSNHFLLLIKWEFKPNYNQ